MRKKTLLNIRAKNISATHKIKFDNTVRDGIIGK